ncbi:hypothetical protein D6C78_05089 [Aureobasidium pullulans]|uniref:Tat pathway signal sequence n=1 Tax=Aureobasidium pullulans TaxID=5580 RepID=A0A4T0BVS3_AURPU|nr:hypothetical protein D6C78_05089 [Aureobasidium pullulans]
MNPPDEINQNAWDALTPIGHGFVNISDPEVYGLPPGITTMSGVDRYSVAMYHQLHCLGLIRNQYWRLIEILSTDSTAAIGKEEVHKQLHQHHPQHCFAYIAESIMCSGDLTIEWAKVEKDGSRTQVDGWGVTHQCKDPDAILEWMKANHGPSKGSNVHLHD